MVKTQKTPQAKDSQQFNTKFLELINTSENPILADGAMGTMLNAGGVGFEQCFDALNVTDPDLVIGVHKEYIGAGAQIIQTNTFGANRFKLAHHDLSSKVREINQAGVEVARKAIQDTAKEVLIAGDVGPLGVRLAPFGRVQPEEARQVFAEQIVALCEAGADLLILETMSDLLEMLEAIAAAHQVCDLPIVASMTFTRDDFTLLGDPPAKVAELLNEKGVDVIGVNCSGGPAQILRIFRQMKSAVPEAKFSAMPNAGWPERVAGRIMYPASPEYFSEYTQALRHMGASLIGGCCGTTPVHIHAMHEVLSSPKTDLIPSGLGLTPTTVEQLHFRAETASELANKLAAGEFIISVEMDPPRGLSTHKLMAGASLLTEAGVDVINIADSPMARMRMSPWAVCSLIQEKLQVETVLHFPTRGRNLLRVQGDLLAAHAMGIRNVFVVMGDPTEIGDYPEAMDEFDVVPSGLIRLIKCGFNLGLDLAGVEIDQPTSFCVGCALNLNPLNAEREMKILHRKIESGADFILTQPLFEPEKALSFIEQYGERYGALRVPVLVGVLPLFSQRHAAFLDNEVPGIEVPGSIQERIKGAGKGAPQEGVRIAVELVAELREWASGIYLMPAFNRYDLALEIIEEVIKQRT